MPKIYETVVYCGRLKEWRIWNITTATVYSSSFETQDAAYDAIEDGVERSGHVVKRVRREDIIEILNAVPWEKA